jgi:ParB family chromosome partitioning protein
MAKFMVDRSVVHKEAEELREKLKEFEGSTPTRRIDPNEIGPSEWANRSQEAFTTADFAQLKKEIASAGGNVQPIKIRPKKDPGESSIRWEIVFGHRRHRACLELGIPVLATIEDGMTDQQLYIEMDRENRDRQDLSAWEQGMMYARALERGLFASNRQLASSLDVDLSQVGKALVLAKLPGEVIAAFASPLELQFRWATQFKDALQKDPDGVLERARRIQQGPTRVSAAKVFAALIGEGESAGKSPDVREWKGPNGKVAATLNSDRKGRVQVNFAEPLDPARRRQLEAFVAQFVEKPSSQAPR